MISINDIVLRMSISLFFSLIIGMERSKNNSNAGIKTHALVAIASTLITLIQVKLSQETLLLAKDNMDLMGVLRSDPARLTAQIVSGIGFLGAGTIIVTKQNITGLTTAASIWAVAALGISAGMGYYDVSLIAFIAILFVLFLIKHIIKQGSTERIVVKYIKSNNVTDDIYKVFEMLRVNHELLKYDVEPFGHELIATSIFELNSHTPNFADRTFKDLSKIRGIVSLSSTNLKSIIS